MALLSSLHSRILPYCPKVTTLLVAQKLQDAAIDFLERTRCYQTELAPQDVVANQAEYTITPPAGFVMVEPWQVRVNERYVYPKSEDALDLHWADLSRGYAYRAYHSSAFAGLDSSNWRYAVATEPRWYFISARTGKLRLVGIPDTGYTGALGLIVAAAWKPKIGVTQIEDAILDDYYQALVDGALARLLAIPEQAWSNPSLAKYHKDEYEGAVEKTQAAIQRNQQRDNQTVYRTVAYA